MTAKILVVDDEPDLELALVLAALAHGVVVGDAEELDRSLELPGNLPEAGLLGPALWSPGLPEIDHHRFTRCCSIANSRPLSDDEDPGIAMELVPLRQKLINMVGRPVNIQATGDLVMFLRGELLGQPYLTLVPREDEGDVRDLANG